MHGYVSREEAGRQQDVEAGRASIGRINDDIKTFRRLLDPSSAPREQVETVQRRIEYHVPKFRTDHSLAMVLANQMHQRREKEYSRLPVPASCTPSPFDTYAGIDKVNLLSTKRRSSSCTMSARYNPFWDFTRQTEQRPIGPGAYDVSRDKLNLLSTSRVAADVRFHQRHGKAVSFGPGPGKYNTTESFGRVTPQLPSYSLKSRSDVFMSFAATGKRKSPGPADYDVSRSRPFLSKSMCLSGAK